MNRREFIEKAVAGIVMIGNGSSIQALSKNNYLQNSESILLRFAIASDGHYGQPGTEYDLFHDDMMKWLAKEHAHAVLSCCVFNGDLIHDDTSYLSAVKKKYDLLTMPYYVSRGNHDRCDSQLWQQTWGYDFNHCFEIGDSAFIILDTSNVNGEIVCPDITWTKTALAKYSAKKHLFVFMHVTPLKWTENGMECNDLVALFNKQSNLKAIFHGHDHDQDNVKIQNGKPHFFDSHLGGNWGTNYRGYRIVEILASNKIITYQVNPINASTVNKNTIH